MSISILLVVSLLVYFIMKSKKRTSSNDSSSEKIYSDSTLNGIYVNYNMFIESACRKHNIEVDVILAIIAQESGGKNNLPVGKAGEIGLMQITPPALREYNTKYGANFKTNDLFIPYANIEIGVGYFAYCFNYFFFTKSLDKKASTVWAIRAYNAGITGALKYDRGIDYYKKVMKWYNKIKEEKNAS